MPTARFTRPRLQLPKGPVAFLFDILRFAVPPTPEVVTAMLAANRALYDQVVALGGKRYPIGAIPDYGREDWKRHYRGEWGRVVSDKHHYDPRNVLAPGQGIFK
jgi:FAD/FMN-containing dehydrogenase